ncbi:MAG: hypothetical protein M3R08_12085 [Bacteroidota bacterium]|nr:hypothetical protein [Bacteroidota bacterium]
MMRIERQPKRNFVLIDGDRELGRLIYPKWWSERAEILLPDGLYEIAAKSFWGFGLSARYQGTPILNISYSWKGGGKIARPDQHDRDLKYKMISFWKPRYKVIDMQGRERMVIRTKLNWRHLDPGHIIEEVNEPPLEPLEILMVIHAINISNRRSSYAAAS